MIRRTNLATILVSTLLASGCGREDVGGTDGQSLTSTETVAPGEECPNGGQRILSGIDVNGNGYLEPNEVLAIEYLCNADLPPTCTTLEGSVTIQNAADWQALVDAGCTRITGTLEVYAPGLTSLGAPAPVVQVGSLRVVDNDELVALDLPALATVDDGLEVSNNPSLARLSLPALTTVGWTVTLVNDLALEALDLSSLATVNGGLHLEYLYPLSALELPALTTGGLVAGSLEITRLELPKLRWGQPIAGGAPDEFGPPSVAVHDCPYLTEVSLPALTGSGYVELGRNERLTSVSAAGMTSGEVGIQLAPALTAVSFPALATGSLLLEGAGALPGLELPALATGSVTLAGVEALTGLDLPVLAAASSLSVDAPALDYVNLPELTSVEHSLTFGLAALGHLSLPKLTAVGGHLTVRRAATAETGGIVVAVSLPKLTSVGLNLVVRDLSALTDLALPLLSTTGGFDLGASPSLAVLSLPALTSVTMTTGAHGGLHLFGLPALANLDLPALSSVDGDLSVYVTDTGTAFTGLSLPSLIRAGSLLVSGAPALASINCPALTTLPIGGGAIGQLGISDNPALTSLTLPALTTAYDLFVMRNAALSDVSLPALTSVLSSVVVTDNPVLPQCLAEAIAAQLQAPLPPVITISNNDTDATCP